MQAAIKAQHAKARKAEAMAHGAQVGLQMLRRLGRQADSYYLYHADRADLLRRMNQRESAAQAYERAITDQCVSC